MLAACCLADLLRVFAPTHPYDDNEIKAIFHCFAEELQGLTRSSSLFDKAFYAIESLSVVQSPVVLVSLPTQGPLLHFVQALLDLLAHPFHNERVEYYVADILSGVLSELHQDEVSPELVDLLLSYLTPQQLQSNPRAAHVVLRLIEKHLDSLERVICKWVQDVVIEPAKRGEPKQKGGRKKKAEASSDDELSRDDEERVESSRIPNRSDQLCVFKELHLEVPQVLASLHAELLDLLTGEVESTRRQFTAFYCEVFTVKPAVIRAMLLLYETLLGRFRDISAAVRLVMAEHVEALLVNVYGGGHSSVVSADDDAELQRREREDKAEGVTSGVNLGGLPHSEQTSLEAVHEHLQISLQDRDDNVRAKTVHGLSRATIHSAGLLNLRLMELMGNRALDKKHEVRKEAIISLADIFHHHLTPYWRKAAAVPSAQRKFSFIPRVLLSACKVDVSNSLFVEMAMDAALIGAKKDEVDGVDERTNCLLAIFSTLEETSRRDVETHIGLPVFLTYREEDSAKALFVNRFVVGKASLQKAVQDCVSIQQQIVTAVQRGDDPQRLQHLRQTRVGAVAQRLLFDDDAHFFTAAGASANAARQEAQRYIADVLLGLVAHDDPQVVEHLQALSDCRATLRDIRAAHGGLVRLIDKKGVKVGEKRKDKGPTATHIANRLACFCSQAILPIDCVPFLFSALQTGNANTSKAALDLLLAIADAWPLMLAPSVERLHSLLQLQGEEDKVVAALHMLSQIDFSTTAVKHSLATKLESLLRRLAQSGSVDVVRYSVRAIKALFTEHTGTTFKSLHKLRINVDLADDVREDKADALLHSLFQHYLERLRLTEADLEAVLVGLGEVSAFYPRLFNQHRDALVKFLFHTLFLSGAPAHHASVLRGIEAMTAFLGSLAMTEDVEVTTHVGKQMLGFYMRVIVNKGVLNLSAAYSAPSTPSSESRRAETEDGDEQGMGDDEEDGDDALIGEKAERQRRFDAVLLTTAKCLTDLCTHPVFHRFLFHVPAETAVSDPSRLKKTYHFGHLAYVATSPAEHVRLPFLDYVLTHLQASRLPFQYCIILCLAADPQEKEEHRQKLKLHLTALVKRERSRALRAEEYREQRSANKPKDKDDSASDGGRGAQKPTVNPALPENALADLIYLLSYHSAFKDPLDSLPPHNVTEAVLQASFALYLHMLTFLDFFLDCAMADKADNFSLLLAIASSVKNSEDVRDKANVNLYKLADLVQLTVHRRSEHALWKNSISSNVTLPKSLYRRRDTAPKERYLPAQFRLPEGKEREKKGGGAGEGGPSTPSKKRKAGDAAPTPQSKAKTPGSAREKKPKAEKEAPTPSRQMPGRLVKSLVATYDDNAHMDEEEDDEDDLLPVKAATPRKTAAVTPKQTRASERPLSAGERQGKENEKAAVNGRVMALGKGGKLEARHAEPVEQGEEQDGEEEAQAEEEEEGEEEEDESMAEHNDVGEREEEEEEEEEEAVAAPAKKRLNGPSAAAASAATASSPHGTARRSSRAGRQ